MEFGPLVNEGKTKMLYEVLKQTDKVAVFFKSIVSRGDGTTRFLVKDKDIYSMQTTYFCFDLLESKGIKTHFVRRLSPISFLAWKLDMIPLEVVVRRIAYGSYLKRYPKAKEGQWLEDPPLEFFLKDDERHDPWAEFQNGKWRFYEAKKPLEEGYIEEIKREEILTPAGRVVADYLKQMEKIAKEAFLILESAWQKLDVVLVDFKAEFGIDSQGNLRIGDDIGYDCWRLWPHGDKELARDKDYYRQAEVTPQVLEKVGEDCRWTAQQIWKFLFPRI